MCSACTVFFVCVCVRACSFCLKRNLNNVTALAWPRNNFEHVACVNVKLATPKPPADLIPNLIVRGVLRALLVLCSIAGTKIPGRPTRTAAAARTTAVV